MKNLKKVLAFTLIFTLLFQFLPRHVIADEIKENVELQTPLIQPLSIKPMLQASEIIILKTSTEEEVRLILWNNLVVNKEELDIDDYEWEYEARSSSFIPQTRWGSVNGFSEGSRKYPALKDIKDGEYKVRIKGFDTFVVVTKYENTPSKVVLKANQSFQYNFDPNKLKEEVFEKVIDWDNSVLPNKASLSIEDFNFEYYAEGQIIGVNTSIKGWSKFEGEEILIYKYPKLGVGDNQLIRVSFVGNDDFTESDKTEEYVKITKGRVKVKVDSTSIRVNESLPSNFIEVSVNDEFDIYTVYVGLANDITPVLFVNLPDRFTDNKVLALIDPVVKAIIGQSFTELLNNGITLGELKQLVDVPEFIEVLEKLNIDLGLFGEIIKIIDNVPDVLDSIKIGFGTPNIAGLYGVTAISDSVNYELALGFGTLLVRMNISGVNLTWNTQIRPIMTLSQAQETDFSAILSVDGDVSVDQSGVSYTYAGLTNNNKTYLSTKRPSEPGKYTVTAYTLYGNHLAKPITRAFIILDTQANRYKVSVKDVVTNYGVLPDVNESITDKHLLPKNTSFRWHLEPDVYSEGRQLAKIKASFGDGSVTIIDAYVIVVDNRDHNIKYSALGQDIITKLNVLPKAILGLLNTSKLPDDTQYLWEVEPNVSEIGVVNGVVLVMYPDSSKQLVDVKVMVLDNELDSEIYTPLRQDITTDLNVIPEAILGIANVEELPDGTTFTWKENPDVSKAGYFLETVIVTYPDESYDEVDVTIIVKDVVKEDIPVVEKEDTTEIVDLEKEKIEEKVPPTGIDYKYSIYVITLALGVGLLLFVKNKKKTFK